MNYLTYRGFTTYEILTLSGEHGQGEALSEYGSKGLWAAIEWIDNFYDKHHQHKYVNGNDVFYPKHDFDWHGWEKQYESLKSRSINGQKKIEKVSKVENTSVSEEK
jgi:hypothetical protein